jgi:hypothetical protein
MKKVLIIGNGPSALENNLGDRIDSNEFDIVCRINRGHKQDNGVLNIGFEKQVGSRCDVWFCSDLRIKLALERSNEYEQIFIYCPAFKYNSLKDSINNETHKNVYLLTPEYEESINQISNFKPQWPSTGIIAMHFLAGIDDLDIYIYGFDTYDSKYDNHHYFENKPNKYKDKTGVDHSPAKEKYYIDYMLKNNKIKIFK